MPLATRSLLAAAALATACGVLGAQAPPTHFPADDQLVARASVSDTEATYEIRGTAQSATDLTARVLDGTAVVSEATVAVSAGEEFALAVAIPVARRNHSVVLLAGTQAVATAERVVAGDVFIINGQSNAIANYSIAAPDRDSFLRGFQANVEPYTWSRIGLAAPGEWGGRAARVLSERFGVPIAVFNFAVGAAEVKFFRPDSDAPHPRDNTSVPVEEGSDLNNFDFIRRNLERADALGKVRAIWWAQGEAESFLGESADYAGQLSNLLDDYQRELGIERLYGIQTRYQACGSTQPFVMEAQRELAIRRDDVDYIASTNVLQNTDGCHFAYYQPDSAAFVGNRVLGEWMADVVTLRTYGQTPPLGAAALNPDVDSARVTGPREITLYFDASGAQMAVTESPWDEFVAEGVGARATGGSVQANRVVLTFDEDVTDAIGATYLGHTSREMDFIHNSDGRGAFTFYNVPVIRGDGDPGNLPDLELAFASDDEDVVPGGEFAVEITLANTGLTTATNVQVYVPLPGQTTYVGQALPDPERGTFDPGASIWTLPALPPRTETSITLTYFVQPAAPPELTVWGEVLAQGVVDEDSSPGNAIVEGNAFGTVREDDEARVVIGDRARDCSLSVEAVGSACDVEGGTWTLTLLAVRGEATDLTLAGIPGQPASPVSLASERAYALDYSALRATGDTAFTVSVARASDATCANNFRVKPPLSCTGEPTGVFTPAAPAPPLVLVPNPVGAGQALRVAVPEGAESVEVYDAAGRPVWRAAVRGGELDIPTAQLRGVYVVRAGRHVGRVVVR